MCFQVPAFTPISSTRFSLGRINGLRGACKNGLIKSSLFSCFKDAAASCSPLYGNPSSSLLFHSPSGQPCSSLPVADGIRTPACLSRCHSAGGTRPCPHPLSHGQLVMTRSQQMMHSGKVPWNPREHHPPQQGHLTGCKPQIPSETNLL